MKPEERIARMIARALGHNDDNGMHWERYVLAARLILKETRIVFSGGAPPRLVESALQRGK